MTNARSGMHPSTAVRLLNHKVLTHEQEIELFRRIEDDDFDAFDEIIVSNTRLAHSIARRYVGYAKQLGHCIDFDDLVQEGIIGIIVAAGRFDYTKNYRFATYATNWIRHKMSRSVHDHGSTIRLPVHLRIELQNFQREVAAVYARLGGELTIEELAHETGRTVAQVERLQLLNQPILPSLDAPIGDDDSGSTLADIATFSEPSHEDEVVRSDSRDIVRKRLYAIMNEALNGTEVAILTFTYGLDDARPLETSEIAQRLGLAHRSVMTYRALAQRKLRESDHLQELSELFALITNTDRGSDMAVVRRAPVQVAVAASTAGPSITVSDVQRAILKMLAENGGQVVDKNATHLVATALSTSGSALGVPMSGLEDMRLIFRGTPDGQRGKGIRFNRIRLTELGRTLLAQPMSGSPATSNTTSDIPATPVHDTQPQPQPQPQPVHDEVVEAEIDTSPTEMLASVTKLPRKQDTTSLVQTAIYLGGSPTFSELDMWVQQEIVEQLASKHHGWRPVSEDLNLG